MAKLLASGADRPSPPTTHDLAIDDGRAVVATGACTARGAPRSARSPDNLDAIAAQRRARFPLAPAGALRDRSGATAPGGRTSRLLLGGGARVSFHRQPARVAVLSRPGPADPVAGHVRQGQRPVADQNQGRAAAQPARRGARAGRRSGRGGIGFDCPVPASTAARPPWVSGLAQGTADPGARPRRRSASATPGISRPPRPGWRSSARRRPAGVRGGVEGTGVHYLIYSFAPKPAGAQRVHPRAERPVRLHAALAGDTEGQALFAQGEAAAARRARALRHGRVVALLTKQQRRRRTATTRSRATSCATCACG